jgi:hypothetical protein
MVVDDSKEPAVAHDQGVVVAVDEAVVGMGGVTMMDLGGVTDAAATAGDEENGSDIYDVEFESGPAGLNCSAASEEVESMDVLAQGSAQEPPNVARSRCEAAAALVAEEAAVSAAEVPPRSRATLMRRAPPQSRMRTLSPSKLKQRSGQTYRRRSGGGCGRSETERGGGVGVRTMCRGGCRGSGGSRGRM